jgi:hypothetical protein
MRRGARDARKCQLYPASRRRPRFRAGRESCTHGRRSRRLSQPPAASTVFSSCGPGSAWRRNGRSWRRWRSTAERAEHGREPPGAGGNRSGTGGRRVGRGRWLLRAGQSGSVQERFREPAGTGPGSPGSSRSAGSGRKRPEAAGSAKADLGPDGRALRRADFLPGRRPLAPLRAEAVPDGRRLRRIPWP